MRKLLNIIALSALAFTVSCDMDKLPKDRTDREEAFKDIKSIEAVERGAYARLKDNYAISNVIVGDLMADYVNAIAGFSNTFGDSYLWNFQRNNAEITETWENCYLTIGQCCFGLDGIAEAMKENRFEDNADALRRIPLIQGRLHLMRAMSYSILAERFCADYEATTATEEHTGVPLIVKYSPDEKPGRATLQAVYDQILKDIAEAKRLLEKDLGVADAIYLNRDCVTALEAHVYLQMDNYEEALKAANSLIGNSAYALANSVEEFSDMWTYDRGKEIIFKLAASKTELPYPYGQVMYYDQQTGSNSSGANSKLPTFAWTPDYIPTQALIKSYEEKDYRRQAWFFTSEFSNEGPRREFSIAGPDVIMPGYTMIYKYPGNPELRTSEQWNFVNTWKVFRLAEMYLIAAEAAIQSNEDAAKPLNELRKHRGLAELPTVTFDDIKAERYRELLMEGFRLTDLKRWGIGFKRGESQYGTFYSPNVETETYEPSKEDYLSLSMGRALEMPATDYRFVWPIPENEIFANQNLANQQNPGWER